MIEKLVEELKNTDEIEALLLGGSRATDRYDANSDYDYYVYLNKELPESKRRDILEKHVKYMEFSNKFWELEDDGVLNNGIEIEFIYRSVEDIDNMLENTLVKGNVSHGYTTCFIDNIMKSKVVFDKTGRVSSLKEKYPKYLNDEFYKKIIDANFPILLDYMPSLYYQVEKAIKRNDLLSVNHRITAFFEVYFDILFALNKETHPGEKRLLETALLLEKVPFSFESNINDLFGKNNVDNSLTLNILENIVIELHQLLLKDGLHYTMRSFR